MLAVEASLEAVAVCKAAPLRGARVKGPRGALKGAGGELPVWLKVLRGGICESLTAASAVPGVAA
jgi:hypothetical protein